MLTNIMTRTENLRDLGLRMYSVVLHRSYAAHFPLKRLYFSSQKLFYLFFFSEAGVTPVGERSLVDLFACTLSISNSNICTQKRHNKLTLTSVVKTWRVDISMTSYLLEGRSAASKACLQVPPPFPLPQHLSVRFPCRIIFFRPPIFFLFFPSMQSLVPGYHIPSYRSRTGTISDAPWQKSVNKPNWKNQSRWFS